MKFSNVRVIVKESEEEPSLNYVESSRVKKSQGIELCRVNKSQVKPW